MSPVAPSMCVKAGTKGNAYMLLSRRYESGLHDGPAMAFSLKSETTINGLSLTCEARPLKAAIKCPSVAVEGYLSKRVLDILHSQ